MATPKTPGSIRELQRTPLPRIDVAKLAIGVMAAERQVLTVAAERASRCRAIPLQLAQPPRREPYGPRRREKLARYGGPTGHRCRPRRSRPSDKKAVGRQLSYVHQASARSP